MLKIKKVWASVLIRLKNQQWLREGKNGPWKMIPGKNGLRKNGPRKNGPREKWSLENWSPEKWSPENWSPGNQETKNRGVGVEHRGVCVECWDVVNLEIPKTRQRTQNSETKPKYDNKKSWGECRASWCVCGMFGCDQSMKTQNSTTNLPGLL